MGYQNAIFHNFNDDYGRVTGDLRTDRGLVSLSKCYDKFKLNDYQLHKPVDLARLVPFKGQTELDNSLTYETPARINATEGYFNLVEAAQQDHETNESRSRTKKDIIRRPILIEIPTIIRTKNRGTRSHGHGTTATRRNEHTTPITPCMRLNGRNHGHPNCEKTSEC